MDPTPNGSNTPWVAQAPLQMAGPSPMVRNIQDGPGHPWPGSRQHFLICLAIFFFQLNPNNISHRVKEIIREWVGRWIELNWFDWIFSALCIEHSQLCASFHSRQFMNEIKWAFISLSSLPLLPPVSLLSFCDYTWDLSLVDLNHSLLLAFFKP